MDVLEKPTRRPHRVVSTGAFILLVGAFILFLLVAISLPILKPVYLVAVNAISEDVPTSIATELRFGVWGVCASSVLNQPTWYTNNGVCYGPMLGYTIPPEYASLAGVSPILLTAVEKSLLVVLILHPIAAALSFFGFILSWFLGPHGIAITTLLASIFAGIVGTIVLAIDLALVLVIRKKLVNELPYHFEVVFGPGVWMVLAAVVMNWLAVVFLAARACYCCGVRK
ncbi:hypothetical protein H0H81_010770 [Sphagnurus paluster]|uniref:Pali-domain-containing protein n=1 Tax=Sphagnurus paluster TaxID=117069 RepID=A0A9P7K574_9AGAR|nr:hypothetical protein H0H81_010770 [Sphagnurus paluster]